MQNCKTVMISWYICSQRVQKININLNEKGHLLDTNYLWENIHARRTYEEKKHLVCNY